MKVCHNDNHIRLSQNACTFEKVGIVDYSWNLQGVSIIENDR